MAEMPPFDWPPVQPGWAWLCGAGPGDPGPLPPPALPALRRPGVGVREARVRPAPLDRRPIARASKAIATQTGLGHAGRGGDEPVAMPPSRMLDWLAGSPLPPEGA